VRIGLVSTVATPVRQGTTGSVEGLVWALSRELARSGHDVTVFATGDSEVCGRLVAALPGPYGRNGAPDDWRACEMVNLCEGLKHSEGLDVLHSHSYLYGLALEDLARGPIVHTMHVSGHAEIASLWRRSPRSWVTAISRFQWEEFPELEPAAVIHHGADPESFTFRPTAGDYVCFLGRFLPGKGPLLAIETARALGLRLALAGPRDAYYQSRVAPLVDGRSVEYVGLVSGAARDQLLGGARALLYPIQAPEPFGLVMVEAMLCGTPVAAIGRGAVPEIVECGVTGYYSQSSADFADAVVKSLALDRAGVRERAMARFSAARMAAEYARVYERRIGGNRAH
jgi:glycosyltransferase involved in cell wall biosynthesis